MQLADMTWPMVQALDKRIPVVIPIAALEQHGAHMPLFTDSLLLGEVVRRSAARMGDRVLIAPLQWLGSSDHHLDFPGTLSAAPRVYLDLLAGLLENFLHHGFERLILLNGHGGNDVPGKQAVFEARQRHRQRDGILLLLATYWSLGASPKQKHPQLVQQQMGHACEWETSMMLRLAPHLVLGYGQVAAVDPGNPFEPACRGWITRERSVPGHIGIPDQASEEKGELLFQKFTADVVAMLERVLAWDGRSWSG